MSNETYTVEADFTSLLKGLESAIKLQTKLSSVQLAAETRIEALNRAEKSLVASFIETDKAGNKVLTTFSAINDSARTIKSLGNTKLDISVTGNATEAITKVKESIASLGENRDLGKAQRQDERSLQAAENVKKTSLQTLQRQQERFTATEKRLADVANNERATIIKHGSDVSKELNNKAAILQANSIKLASDKVLTAKQAAADAQSKLSQVLATQVDKAAFEEAKATFRKQEGIKRVTPAKAEEIRQTLIPGADKAKAAVSESQKMLQDAVTNEVKLREKKDRLVSMANQAAVDAEKKAAEFDKSVAASVASRARFESWRVKSRTENIEQRYNIARNKAEESFGDKVTSISEKIAASRTKAANQAIRDYNLQVQAAAKLKEAEDALARSNAARASVAGIVAPLTPGGQATVGQRVKLGSAKEALATQASKQGVSPAELKKTWDDVTAGATNYESHLQKIASLMYAVRQAHAATANGMSAGNNANLNESVLIAGSLGQQKKAAEALLISWQSVARMAASQTISRSIGFVTSELAAATQQALEFSIQMAAIQTIDKTRSPVQGWVEGIRALNEDNGLGLLDNTKAAYQALSNQIGEGTRNLAFLKDASDLAVVGLSTQAQAVDVLSSVINSWGYSISDTEELSAKLFKTVELGRVTLSELSANMGRLTVPAAQLGVSFEELDAAIAATTIKGVKFETASTFIRNVIMKLQRPSKDLKDFLASIGFESGEAAVKTLGLAGVLGKLEERTNGSSTELAELFRDIRAISGATVFSGAGLKVFQDDLLAISAATKTYRENVNLVKNSLGKEWDVAKAKISDVFTIDVSTQMLTTVSSLTNHFKLLADTVIFLSPALTGVAVAIATGIVVASIRGTVALAKMTLEMVALARASFATSEALTAAGAAARWNVATLAIITVAEAVSFLTSYTERFKEENSKALTEWIANLDKISAAQEKVNKERKRQLDSTLKREEAYYGKMLALANKAYFEEEKKLNMRGRSLKDLDAYAKEAEQESLRMLEAGFDKAKSKLEEMKSSLKSLSSEMKDAQRTLAESKFEKTLIGKSESSKFRLSMKEAQRLKAETGKAAEAGDFESFKALAKDTEAMFKKAEGFGTTSQQKRAATAAISFEEEKLAMMQKMQPLMEAQEKSARDSLQVEERKKEAIKAGYAFTTGLGGDELKGKEAIPLLERALGNIQTQIVAEGGQPNEALMALKDTLEKWLAVYKGGVLPPEFAKQYAAAKEQVTVQEATARSNLAEAEKMRSELDNKIATLATETAIPPPFFGILDKTAKVSPDNVPNETLAKGLDATVGQLKTLHEAIQNLKTNRDAEDFKALVEALKPMKSTTEAGKAFLESVKQIPTQATDTTSSLSKANAAVSNVETLEKQRIEALKEGLTSEQRKSLDAVEQLGGVANASADLAEKMRELAKAVSPMLEKDTSGRRALAPGESPPLKELTKPAEDSGWKSLVSSAVGHAVGIGLEVGATALAPGVGTAAIAPFAIGADMFTNKAVDKIWESFSPEPKAAQAPPASQPAQQGATEIKINNTFNINEAQNGQKVSMDVARQINRQLANLNMTGRNAVVNT